LGEAEEMHMARRRDKKREMGKESKGGNDKERFRADTIAANLRHARRLMPQVNRLVEDRERLREAEEAECDGSRPAKRALERRREKIEARELRLRQLDNQYVLAALERKAPLEGAYMLEGSSEVDELLWLVAHDLKALPVLEELKPRSTTVRENTGKTVLRREMYPSQVHNLVSLVSRFLGVEGGPDVQAVVLTDPRWMTLFSFTLEEVKKGATRRSEELTGKTRSGAGGKFEDAGESGTARNSGKADGNRGAFSSQTVAGHEAALEAAALEEAFNKIVQIVAARGLLPRRIVGALDSTSEESVPSMEGAGIVRKKVKVQCKVRRPRSLEVMVKGFKMWALMDTATAFPRCSSRSGT